MKHPSQPKKSNALDVDIRNGTWNLSGTANWITGNSSLEHIITADISTFDQGAVPFSVDGTHFSIQATTTSVSPAVSFNNFS